MWHWRYDGLWSEISKEFGVEVKSLTGIDPSSGMLKEARAKFPNFKFIEAYADNTTLASGEAQIFKHKLRHQKRGRAKGCA